MGDFFSGFLKGFSDVGGEILKEQDEAQRKINEIVKTSDETIRVNDAKIKSEAAAELATRQAMIDAYRIQNNLTSAPSVLQTTSSEPVVEEDIDTSESTTGTGGTAFTGMSAPQKPAATDEYGVDPREVLEEAMATGEDPAKIHAEKRRAAATDRRMDKRLAAQFDQQNKIQVQEEWAQQLNNDKSQINNVYNKALSAHATLSRLDGALKSNKVMNNMSKKDVLMSSMLPDLSPEAKALVDAGIDEITTRGKDMKPLSNDETNFLKSVSVNANNPYLFNLSKIRAAQVFNANLIQMQEFLTAAQEKGVRPQSALSMWIKYENKRDYLKDKTAAKITDADIDYLASDDSWKDMLDLPREAKNIAAGAAGTASQQPTTNSSALSFESLLEEAQTKSK